MIKKIISISLSVVMLLCLCTPALAATQDTEPTETRTVEDILSEYHEKSFASKVTSASDEAAAYSRQAESSSKSLEEETVETLIAAGYEAYHVTSSNYEAVEDALHTDLSDLNLDENESYIVVVSGEENPGSRAIDPPSQDIFDGGSSSEEFLYYYNGTNYRMRYLTVTSDDSDSLSSYNSVVLFQQHTLSSSMLSALANLINSGIYAGLDAITAIPIGTIAGFLGVSIVSFPVGYEARLELNATCNCTRKFTQIYLEDYDAWSSFSSVDYITATSDYAGMCYSTTANQFVYPLHRKTEYYYSSHYYDTSWQKQQAAIAFEYNYRNHEYAGDFRIYREDENGNKILLLTVYQPY